MITHADNHTHAHTAHCTPSGFMQMAPTMVNFLITPSKAQYDSAHRHSLIFLSLMYTHIILTLLKSLNVCASFK